MFSVTSCARLLNYTGSQILHVFNVDVVDRLIVDTMYKKRQIVSGNGTTVDP
jgi:hypothetical protein